MTEYDIFISYSRKDDSYARRIVEELENNGFKVFFDVQSIAPGKIFANAINEAIASAPIFIPLITETYIQSNFAQQELILAMEEKRQIIPCTLDRVQKPAWLILCIGDIMEVPLNMHDFPDEKFRTLVNRIKTILNAGTNRKTESPEKEETPSQQLCKLKFVNDNNSEIQIMIDGNHETTLPPEGIAIIERESGSYIIKTKLERTIENKFDQEFNQDNNGTIIHLKSYDSSTHFKGQKKYQCFIAGATSITNQRNAARAVISMLHNEYEEFNCDITSHTYEDFSNRQNEYGQQDQYNDFIENTADCAIFIICKKVGPKTKEEYQRAMNALKKNGKRPAIFVYNDATPEYDADRNLVPPTPDVVEFQELVKSHHCYWADYYGIDYLMNLIRIDINRELKKALNLRPQPHPCQ